MNKFEKEAKEFEDKLVKDILQNGVNENIFNSFK